MSHWPVNDALAARLTTDAVARAEAGQSRARAMQAAMAAILTAPGPARQAHPGYWAPFQIVGVDTV